MSNYLDLNKKKIKESVVSKLKMLGYEVDINTPIRKIQEIIRVIQRDNNRMIDGLIGGNTIGLLYNYDEIMELLCCDYPTVY